MPVRSKAVDRALRLAMGDRSYHFNNQKMTATVDGEVMAREEFDEKYWNPVERIYETVVDSIDWNRVMLEASARHGELTDHPELDPEHDKRNVGDAYDDVLCPECLCEALLADDTMVNWKVDTKAPRYHESEPGPLSRGAMGDAMRNLDAEDRKARG